jgi:hypothetical protein
MKKLLFLGACLVALASQPVMAQTTVSQPVLSQTTEPQVVIVQLTYTGFGAGHLSLIRGAGKTEKTDFSGQSGEVLQVVITRLSQEGYSLKGTFAAGASTAMMVFMKGQ